MKFNKTLAIVFAAAAGVVGCATTDRGALIRQRELDHLEAFDRQVLAQQGYSDITKYGQTGKLDEKTGTIKPPRYLGDNTDLCYYATKAAEKKPSFVCVVHNGVGNDVKVVPVR